MYAMIHNNNHMSEVISNIEKFEQVRRLCLPIGHYAISSSGPLGIRGLREVSDIDIVVDESLWMDLAGHYGVEKDKVEMIKIPPFVEVIHEGSFPDADSEFPSVEDQIKESEIIEGLPFVNLRHILAYKIMRGTVKDQEDISLIMELNSDS